MYTIMIAEDEAIERESLKTMIHTSHLAVDEVFLAKDGEEAVHVFRECRPQLLLMDINMPKMNGLDALKMIRSEEAEETPCLILTSYDTFAYAQKAIHLGIEDFILKPSKQEAIIESIQRVLEKLQMNNNIMCQTKELINRMDQMQPHIEEECAYAILMGQNEIILHHQFQLLNIHMKQGCCILIEKDKIQKQQLISVKENFEALGYRFLMTKVSKWYAVFLISCYKMSEDILNIKQQLLAHSIKEETATFGPIVTMMEDLYRSYQTAIHRSEMKKEETSEATQEVFVTVWCDRFQRALEEENLPVVVEAFLQEVVLIPKAKITDMVKEILYHLIAYAKRSYHIDIDEQKIQAILITEEESVSNIKVKLHDVFEYYVTIIKTLRFKGSNHRVKQAIEYISNNYRKAIALSDLADYMGVTPTYISHLLNTYSSKNFTDIVNEYRIKEAKSLIHEQMLLKDVSYRVGFRSTSYFAKIFKKMVGMTPKEYSALFC